MPCPDENQWLEFAQRTLTPRRFGELERHLDSCGECHELVRALVRGGMFSAAGESTASTDGEEEEPPEERPPSLPERWSGATSSLRKRQRKKKTRSWLLWPTPRLPCFPPMVAGARFELATFGL